LPQAVNYSAGFLQYFFRGRLEVEVFRECRGTRLRVTNRSRSPLALVGGQFSLFAEDADGNRELVPDFFTDYRGVLPNGESFQGFLQMPPGVFKQFVLVYRGRIGADEGVIGKVFKIPTDTFVFSDPELGLGKSVIKVEILDETQTAQFYQNRFGAQVAGRRMFKYTITNESYGSGLSGDNGLSGFNIANPFRVNIQHQFVGNQLGSAPVDPRDPSLSTGWIFGKFSGGGNIEWDIPSGPGIPLGGSLEFGFTVPSDTVGAEYGGLFNLDDGNWIHSWVSSFGFRGQADLVFCTLLVPAPGR
jgi:hypothetical protein